MDLILRGSEYQSFLTCRKQWLYQWVIGLEPKKPDNKLFFGTLFHKWLEIYYKNQNAMVADLQTSIWFNEQDLSGMEQTEIDELKSLFTGVRDHYLKTYREADSQWKILGTEVKFLVKLDDELFYTGTIDLVYEVDGKIRFADHKTVASLSMYEEKSKMDRQISRYWYVMKQFSEGRARILDETTENWKHWHEVEGKEIDGFDYNLIAKDFPKEPKVLKSGKLSTDKSQKTSYDLYVEKIHELNQNPNDYSEFLSFLKEKPEQFVKRIDVRRNETELMSAMYEFTFTAGDMHDVRMLIQNNPNVVDQVTYRNIGSHCSTMCVFKHLCQTTIEGGNVGFALEHMYQKKERE